MKKNEVIKRMKAASSEGHLHTYPRHGITGDAYGVPYSELYKLRKEIGTDAKLAEELWETNNHDARVLATMIADPDTISPTVLNRWAKTVDNPLSEDAIANLAARTKRARAYFTKWSKARHEWLASTGWHLLGVLARQPESPIESGEWADLLKTIEANIHEGPNRVRYAMNGALISIGVRDPGLEKLALAAAKRIGKVDVDHGDTSCKTPDAITYIKKAVARKNQRAAKKKTSKKGRAKASKTTKKTTRKTKARVTKRATKKPTTRTGRKKARTQHASRQS